jgi:hypothetical protein
MYTTAAMKVPEPTILKSWPDTKVAPDGPLTKLLNLQEKSTTHVKSQSGIA